MATSGTFRNNFRTGYAIQIVWSQISQSIEDNTTTIQARVQLVSTGASYTINSTASKNGSLTINGVRYNFTFSAQLNGNQTKTLYTKTVQILHNPDGTKTCNFATTCGINVTLSGVYWGNVNASGSSQFDTIPRATTPSLSVTSQTIGSQINITLNRASTSFTHNLTYAFGNQSGTIGTDIATSVSWTLPLSLCDAIPNSNSGVGTITCKTYSGSKLIGTKTVNFTGNVPSSVVPSITDVAVSEGVSSFPLNAYVQNKSKLNVSITAIGSYSSTIKSYKTTIEGLDYATPTFVSNVLSTSGSVIVAIVVTDSRNRQVTTTRTVTVVDYNVPTIHSFIGQRSTSAGVPDYEGSYLKCDLNFNISQVNNLNQKQYKIEYRIKGTTAWATMVSGSSYELNESILSTSGIVNVDNAYDVKLTLTDSFGSVSTIIDIPTAFTLVDFRASGKGIAIGKVSERDSMEIALDVEISGKLTASNIKAGKGSLTPVANTPTSIQITFDEPFNTVPNVVACLDTTVAGTTVTGISVNDITTSGFKIYITRTNNTNTYFNWIAIGL